MKSYKQVKNKKVDNPLKTFRNENTKKKKINLKIFLYLFLIFLAIYLYLNWKNIIDYIGSLKLDNKVSEIVIEDYDGKESPHIYSGVNKMILIISKNNGLGEIIDSIYVFTNSDQKEFKMIQYIPGEVYIRLYNNEIKDEIKVSDLFYIGESKNEELGEEFTIWQIERLLATEFDSYIWINSEGSKVLEKNFNYDFSALETKKISELQKISSVWNVIFKSKYFDSLAKNTYSNRDLISNYNFLNKFSSDLGENGYNKNINQYFISYANSEYLVPDVHLNGEEISILEYEKIDESIDNIKDNFLSKDLVREQGKIEIYNGSGIPGLAARYSRVFSNNGLPVIRIGNSEEGYSKTTIYIAQKEEYSSTLAYVKVLLGNNEYIIEEKRPLFMATADIVIVLGSDLVEPMLPFIVY